MEYGVTTAYGSVVSLRTLETSHQVNLFGLDQDTLYNYRVKSRDEAGNMSTSGNFTFKTAKVLPSIDEFKTTPDSIDTVPPGGVSSVLSFSAKNATSLRLDPGAINVTGSDIQNSDGHHNHDLHLDGDQQRGQRDPKRHGEGTVTAPNAMSSPGAPELPRNFPGR